MDVSLTTGLDHGVHVSHRRIDRRNVGEPWPRQLAGYLVGDANERPRAIDDRAAVGGGIYRQVRHQHRVHRPRGTLDWLQVVHRVVYGTGRKRRAIARTSDSRRTDRIDRAACLDVADTPGDCGVHRV